MKLSFLCYNRNMKEKEWEKKYQINTSKSGSFYSDELLHRYEPTSYEVLERIKESGYICKEDILVDVGCGKGRVPIYFADEVGCKCIGIDINEEYILKAKENQKKRDNVFFECMDIVDVHFSNETVLYFFNPFSHLILRQVINNLMESVMSHPRGIRCLFYYLDDDSLNLLMSQDELICVDEIDCSDLFSKNKKRERVFVFEIGSE